MDIKNKIIELANGKKYIVADTVIYADRRFMILGEVMLETEDLGEFAIYEKIDNRVEKVLDEELIENLKKVFQMNIPEIN